MDDNTLAIIVALIGMVPGAIALVIQLTKARAEKSKIKSEGDSAAAEAVGKFADAAGKVADTNQRLQERADQLERELGGVRGEVVQLKTVIASQNKRITELEHEMAKWQEWARRLAAQVTSLGATPVKMEDAND